MPRMCIFAARSGLLASLWLACALAPARADLIRGAPGRSFPEIAGDVGGSQTYVYDPTTQTGTFALINAPHLISLGPSGRDLIPMGPDSDGTLMQWVQLKLDRSGRIINSPLNRFEIRGTVVINNQTYEGLLLAGRPTAFGLAGQARDLMKDPESFGLNMQIEGGKLAEAFGPEAYLRIIPQANSTFRGEFTQDFSGEKPLTNLIAVETTSDLGLAVPLGMAALVGLGLALTVWKIAHAIRAEGRGGSITRARPVGTWAGSTTW